MPRHSENYSEPEFVTQAHELVGQENELIITFCNSAYRKLLANWLVPLREYGLRVLVFAMDEELACELEREGVPVVRTYSNNELATIWKKRINVIHTLSASGLSVIHSDVDAVWIKNPLELLKQVDADIVGSQGTIHPPECHAAWGHVLCCGFVQYRATEAVSCLLSKVVEASDEERFDDQKYLNKELLALAIEWQVQEPYSLEFRGATFRCSREPIVGVCHSGEQSIRVVILPHARVQRLPNKIERKEDVYVSHPIAAKEACDKRNALCDAGSWFLDCDQPRRTAP